MLVCTRTIVQWGTVRVVALFRQLLVGVALSWPRIISQLSEREPGDRRGEGGEGRQGGTAGKCLPRNTCEQSFHTEMCCSRSSGSFFYSDPQLRSLKPAWTARDDIVQSSGHLVLLTPRP